MTYLCCILINQMSVFRSTWSTKVLDLQKKFNLSAYLYLHILIHWDVFKLLRNTAHLKIPFNKTNDSAVKYGTTWTKNNHIFYKIDRQSYTKQKFQDVSKLLTCRTLVQKWGAFMFYLTCITLGIIVLSKWSSRVGLAKSRVYTPSSLSFERRKINKVGWVPI